MSSNNPSIQLTPPPEKTQFGFRYPGPGACVAAGVGLPAVCLVLFTTRLYVRYRSKEHRTRIGWDDWVIFAAFVPVLVMGIVFAYGVEKRVFAYPSPSDITIQSLYKQPPQMELDSKLEFIMSWCQVLAVGLVKISILLFLRRLFATHGNRLFKHVSLALIWIIGIFTTAFTIGIILNCGSDVALNWGGTLERRKHCKAQFLLYEGFAIGDFILDLIVLSLPFPLIWKLKMNWSRKAQIISIFLLAWFALAASIIRMVIYIRIYRGGSNQKRANIWLVTTLCMYWAMVEAGVSWIAACLPIFFGAVLGAAHKRSPLSMIRSVLSVVSSSSARSARSQASRERMDEEGAISRQQSDSELKKTNQPRSHPVQEDEMYTDEGKVGEHV